MMEMQENKVLPIVPIYQVIPNQTFELHTDDMGGMIVDSGTIFTVLVESAFRVVADHVAEVLGQPALNTTSLESPCFPAPAGERQLPAMPDMVLHFAGGADMTLHRDNYMSFDGEDSSFCLNIAGATSTSTSVLGNFQQQNIHLLFDITVGQMSFVPTDCSKLWGLKVTMYVLPPFQITRRRNGCI